MLSARPLLPALFALASVLPLSVQAAPPGGEMPPAQVTLETVKAADFPLELKFPGRTAGYREVEVRAQVSGILQERTYEEGSQVTKGQVLFRIDPRTYQAALARAKAALAQEQARYRQAERNLLRIRELQKKGFASESELDNAISSFEQTRANVQAAEAELQARQIDLDYTTVKAPISGITSKETRSEGSLMVAGNPEASLLTQITQMDPVYVNFAYPDQVLERIRADLQSGNLSMPADGKLRVELQLGNGQAYPSVGHVDFTDSLIARGTGTVSARAVIENPKQELLPGQFVSANVQGFVYPNAISVPERAVTQVPSGAAVMVVDSNNVAHERLVKLGPTANQRWLILDGLVEGDRVVVDGIAKVMPETEVVVVSDAERAQ